MLEMDTSAPIVDEEDLEARLQCLVPQPNKDMRCECRVVYNTERTYTVFVRYQFKGTIQESEFTVPRETLFVPIAGLTVIMIQHCQMGAVILTVGGLTCEK